MRIFFAGVPECAVPALCTVARNHTIVGVLTNPPASLGRSKCKERTPVSVMTDLLKAEGSIDSTVPILTPYCLNDDFRSAVVALKPDIMVCFAYGKIFGPKTLALFPKGALNIHPSLLPRWRGPSPVPAALAAGDTVTGVTIQYMVREMDAGDIVMQKQLEINPRETADKLLHRCAVLGAELVIQALQIVAAGTVSPVPQSLEGVCYCRLLEKEDGHICWNESATEIDRKIRAAIPWPGAFTFYSDIKIAVLVACPYTGVFQGKAYPAGYVLGTDKKDGLLIQTGSGILAVQTLQRQTKKAMFWKDFLNGMPNFIGSPLS